ncbi:MAG: DUF1501 domain-containing protein [Planctomycetia bacterium]|nr:DUF1501 domain-containing protein [Planctomycetia bacterium]
MLTLSYGDRSARGMLSRRGFLQVGSLGLGGLTLAELLRLRAQGKQPATPKSVILIFLAGGPSHIDMYDMKPDAPAEYRGEFKPIDTNVPGINVCELMPMQARIADKLAIVRTVQMRTGLHNDLEPLSGHLYADPESPLPPIASGPPRPSFGSVVSYVRGRGQELPAYVSLLGNRPAAGETPAFLGAAHRAFVPRGPDLANLSLAKGFSADRLADRRQLLGELDTLRRDLDTRGEAAGMDAFTAQALDLITSPRTREAFDVSKESVKTRERYGATAGGQRLPGGAGQFLRARRLVEAGVSVVTVGHGGVQWDTHSRNFTTLRELLPPLDASLHALVTDLHERGLDKDVAVLMWGEFGRTPRINANAGRDHHGAVSFALFAGGGLRMGQTVGATDARAERPRTRPFSAQNVFATLYHVLGIDPAQTVPDHNGRPVHLLDEREPIAELV